MKNLFLLATFVATILFASCSGLSQKGDAPKVNEPFQTEVPERPAGQEPVLGLTTPKLDTVRVGFIGLGMRGPGAVQRFVHIPGTKIVAFCDLHADRVEKSQTILDKAGLPRAAEYSGSQDAWKKLCERDDIDLVYIATNWQTHADMVVYAMEQGKHVAVEVPGATTLDDIWRIVDTAEKKRVHCMMLENCVYDFFELTTLNMIQKGIFGEILYAEGAYIHQLEKFWNAYESDWRMEFNRHNRGDV